MNMNMNINVKAKVKTKKDYRRRYKNDFIKLQI